MKKLSSYVSLFTSTGTLFCCALPSLLVALGMGATMAGLVTTFPQMIWLSKYKAAVFILSGLLICFAAWLQYTSKKLDCPTDPELAAACSTSRDISTYILAFSAFIWLVGLFFAFIAPSIL